MHASLTWDQDMQFTARVGNNQLIMDSKPPLGKDKGMTPKELVAAGMAGCTAMDVVALLKKHKQKTQSLKVDVDIESSHGGHPTVFTSALITFVASGEIDAKILMDSVILSQTKYCGVSAMMSKALPIHYKVILNDQEIGTGQAQF